MNALMLVIIAACVFAIGYRFYGLFIANRVLRLDANRPTPAVKMADGRDYVKTNKFILFGHHFAAIAAAGPLMGPVLAAQFGYLPGALWIIIGAVVAGAVHDMVVLFASVRHRGHSLANIARREIDLPSGGVASFAILFILILTLAGLSLAVVNTMAVSPWSTFTVFATMPIALIMGVYLHRVRPGDVFGVSVIGVGLLAIVIYLGPYIPAIPALANIFTLSKPTISFVLPVYGFIASVLPVWLLLCPRDYLSSYLKISTIVLLALGIIFVHPHLQMPPLTRYVFGGGPVVPGAVFPFIFITIACGALSGFHAIIGTGTTPKMIGNEKDILFIGYGAMLVEGFVAIMALIAACVLVPADYLAINAPAQIFQTLGLTPVHLPALSQAVGETLQGRTGGGVSLAVGMAYIFSAIPFMKNLMSYWYHFAIMFEAVFILAAVDTGTRVGRFLLQEIAGNVIPKFKEEKWVPGIIICGALFSFLWGRLLYTGSIATIWPLFGISNQLLAACGLIVGTTLIIRLNRVRYAWITVVPGIFIAVITFLAGGLLIIDQYLPQGHYFLIVFSISIAGLMLIIFYRAIRRWFRLIGIKETVIDNNGDKVLAVVDE
jgi:carbon starvation protein